MRHICASHLPATNFDREQIEELARKIHVDLQVRFGEVSGHRIYKLVDAIGGRIVCDLDLSQNQPVMFECDGPQQFTIHLAPWTTMDADKFAVAVGLGYYFIHANQGIRPGCIHDGQEPRQRHEAVVFAAELFMPASVMVGSAEELAKTLGFRINTIRDRLSGLGESRKAC